jgi:hypothetical protein
MAHRLPASRGGPFNLKAGSSFFDVRRRGLNFKVSQVPTGTYPKKRNPYPGFLTPDQHLLFRRILSDACRVLVRGLEDFPPGTRKRT